MQSASFGLTLSRKGAATTHCLQPLTYINNDVGFIPSVRIANYNNNQHPFNGSLSGTTQVSQYQKGKSNLDFTEARGNEWQWHQLCHMQICTSLKTDNHASTPPLQTTGWCKNTNKNMPLCSCLWVCQMLSDILNSLTMRLIGKLAVVFVEHFPNA